LRAIGGEVREKVIAGPLILHDRRIPMEFNGYDLSIPIGTSPDWRVMCEFALINSKEVVRGPDLCSAVARMNSVMQRMKPAEAVKIKKGFMLVLRQEGEEKAIAYAEMQSKLWPQFKGLTEEDMHF
jgi:hypothetical protein